MDKKYLEGYEDLTEPMEGVQESENERLEEREENDMDIKTKKSIVELQHQYTEAGVEFGVIKVDGKPFVSVGFTSEADKVAAMKAVEIAIAHSNGNTWKAMQAMQTMCNLGENKATVEKEVEVNGRIYLLSFKDKTAYDKWGEPYVDIKDVDGEVPVVAAEALLVERIKNKQMEESEFEDEYDEEEEEDYEE